MRDPKFFKRGHRAVPRLKTAIWIARNTSHVLDGPILCIDVDIRRILPPRRTMVP